ncbi:MAG TPA: hypothetical protein VMH39_07430, partial [Gemmatimonadaceae bacterium]|nr:hypothetical protein [Gemmatimonadaceae bacterium]
ILDSVRTLRKFATTNEQIVTSALVEGLADHDRDDDVSACAALSRVKALASSTSRANLVTTALVAAQCQDPTSP